MFFLVIVAIAVSRAAFGQGSGLVYLYNLGCYGSESSLLSCSHNGIRTFSWCSHSHDAGVVCLPCKSYT